MVGQCCPVSHTSSQPEFSEVLQLNNQLDVNFISFFLVFF